ncbi:MAG: PEP-CTERM sorting domain-containing protein [Acidobacteria bacterium]|nr:PEP-CTERM sorting domain-containing protein [Acidobacteriota bacterium]
MSGTPGVDSETAEMLGHSVSISMVSLASQAPPSNVPEPSTLVLMIAGSALVGLRKLKTTR